MNARSPTLDADAALRCITAGDRIYVASGLGHPDTLVPSLLRRAASVGPLTVVTSLLGPLPAYCDPAVAGLCRVLTFRGTRASRAAFESGQTELVPAHLSAIPRLLRGPLRPDVAIVQVTAPDSSGRYSLGASVLYQRSAIAAAGTVVAEVNPQLPWAGGDAVLARDDIDILVDGEHPLPQQRVSSPTAAAQAVAQRVVDLVPDGATVQVGIGEVGNAVVERLRQRTDLRLHTGLVSESLLKLLDSDALATGQDVVVCGAAYGSTPLYERLGTDQRVSIRGVEYTHDCTVLAGFETFIAINGAVEIDLDGQINVENIDGVPISGIGGQGDFFRGAAMAQNGLPIVAMTARTPFGRPRIVERLQYPGTVSTPRSDAVVVVTEYGVADLRGLGTRDRSRALRAIAGSECGTSNERVAI
jgi:acyl-CoA hydrolase